MSTKLSDTQNVIVGVLAAFIEAVLLQPTLYWKNARANNLPFTLNPKKLYRGTAASIFNECQMMGLQFGVTSHLQKMFYVGGGGKGINELVAATGGGMITAAFASPVELVMVQQQLFGGNALAVPASLYAKYGFSTTGLMRGVGPAICRDAIYVGAMLGLTPMLQRYIEQTYKQSPAVASLFASLMGGVIAAIPSHPFDIVKTCMQGDMKQEKYKSATDTFKRLLREGGARRVFAGGFWRTFNITATVFIANESANRLPQFLFASSSASRY